MVLYDGIDADVIEEQFYKSVYAVVGIADAVGCAQYQLLEAEMYRATPDDVNILLFSETVANFRNYFYRQVRRHLSPLLSNAS